LEDFHEIEDFDDLPDSMSSCTSLSLQQQQWTLARFEWDELTDDQDGRVGVYFRISASIFLDMRMPRIPNPNSIHTLSHTHRYASPDELRAGKWFSGDPQYPLSNLEIFLRNGTGNSTLMIRADWICDDRTPMHPYVSLTHGSSGIFNYIEFLIEEANRRASCALDSNFMPRAALQRRISTALEFQRFQHLAQQVTHVTLMEMKRNITLTWILLQPCSSEFPSPCSYV
jgi:hypothetical protein